MIKKDTNNEYDLWVVWLNDINAYRNKIICGNTLDVLKQIPDDSVDCIITSPPYWGLRFYGEQTKTIWDGDPNCEHEWGEVITERVDETGFERNRRGLNKSAEEHDGNPRYATTNNPPVKKEHQFCKKCGAWFGQLGLEPDLGMYHNHLLQITAELKRILKKTGTMWWVHGDSYCGSQGHFDAKNPKAREGKLIPDWKDYPKKCLYLQNYRLAIRMIDEQGWILRNSICWCLAEGTKMFILRNKKYFHLPIEKVEIGDMVLTIDREKNFRWVRVKNKFNNGTMPILKITTETGREIYCSEEHQFPVKSTYYYGNYIKLRFKKAKDLTTKDCLWVNHYLPNIMQEQVNEDDYQKGFIVGFYLAEGSYIKRKVGIYKDNLLSFYAQKRWGRLKRPKTKIDGVQFSCGILDKERGYLRHLDNFRVSVKEYGNKVAVYSRDRKLISLIRKYVNGEGCDKKHLSQNAWNVSLEFIKGIVDGFLAGDGSYDKKNNRWRGCIKLNPELRDDLLLACRLIGYEYRYEGTRNTEYGTQSIGFSIRKELKRKSYNFLYGDKIKKIEKVGENQVFDIEVEPIYTSFCGKGKSNKPSKDIRKNKWNNLYFLANGIWTHNSKPNHMPSSVTDRLSNAYEPVFFFTKSQRYFFDLDSIRVPPKTHENRPYGIVRTREWNYNSSYPQVWKLEDVHGIKKETPEITIDECNEIDDAEIQTLKEIQQYSGSPGRRAKLSLIEGKLTTTVRKKLYDVGNYLKTKLKEANLTVQQLAEITGLRETTIAHYFRTDLSGQAIPDRNTWEILKPILKLGNYDDYISEEIHNALPQPHPLGKNPGDVWTINTQPGPPEARGKHFAMFPEKLVQSMILAGCPREVCKKCGKPRLPILKSLFKQHSIGATSGCYHVERNFKGDNTVVNSTVRIGWTDCGCGAGFEPGIVLDPFAGSGTTCVVAKKLGYDYIGIEINPEYCEIARIRLEKTPRTLALDRFTED